MSKEETIKVQVSERLPAEKALRKFKRLCETYGITKEYRRRQSHQKPSIKAKEKREAAEKRRLKNLNKSRRGKQKI
jgi:small subunit ribosomal protein S21